MVIIYTLFVVSMRNDCNLRALTSHIDTKCDVHHMMSIYTHFCSHSTCSLWLCSFPLPQVKLPKCDHYLHEECLEQLLYTRLSKCPLCRSSVDQWRRSKHYHHIEEEIAQAFRADTDLGMHPRDKSTWQIHVTSPYFYESDRPNRIIYSLWFWWIWESLFFLQLWLLSDLLSDFERLQRYFQFICYSLTPRAHSALELSKKMYEEEQRKRKALESLVSNLRFSAGIHFIRSIRL